MLDLCYDIVQDLLQMFIGYLADEEILPLRKPIVYHYITKNPHLGPIPNQLIMSHPISQKSILISSYHLHVHFPDDLFF